MNVVANAAPQFRRERWAWYRFSLRDLLLGTLLCALLAAWIHERRERQRPLKPSHIADYFSNGLQSDIAAARSFVGETGQAWSFAPATSMDLKGVYKAEHSLNREWFCELNLPWTKAALFQNELIRRLSLHIRQGEAGEHISTSEYEAEMIADMPDAFHKSIKYHCGEVHGVLRIYVTKTSDQNARLVASVSEHRVP